MPHWSMHKVQKWTHDTVTEIWYKMQKILTEFVNKSQDMLPYLKILYKLCQISASNYCRKLFNRLLSSCAAEESAQLATLVTTCYVHYACTQKVHDTHGVHIVHKQCTMPCCDLRIFWQHNNSNIKKICAKKQHACSTQHKSKYTRPFERQSRV